MASFALASPAVAQGTVQTRLVRCGAESCLLVTGHRENAASSVLINDHPVAVQGGRRWRVRLPVATVRAWSAPFARRISVSMKDASGRDYDAVAARLPIGLLGHAPDLASLIITLH